jgi:glycosyltransferase involved in cell wall biosynthesis
MKQVIVTTSWDDGHVLDMRLADLLKKYNLPGTFYVSPQDREFPKSELLTDAQVLTLSQGYEIGAHTMTHPRLTKISDADAYQEMLDSKLYLQDVIGKRILSFCYPGGNYKRRHARLAANAGFVYARTVKRHINDLKDSLFVAGTSVNCYNHYQDLWKIACFVRFNPKKTIEYFQWENLAKAMFDHVSKTGGVFHLWGHSWEIDQHGDWDKLEEVFKYISRRPDVTYCMNGELPKYQDRKLLIATPYYPPHLGGVEFYVANIAKELDSNLGWDVSIVTTGERGWKVDVKTENNMPIYRLPYWFKVSNTPVNFLWPLMLRRIIKKENVSIINAHAPVPIFADLALRVNNRIPVVVTYHMMSMAKGRSGADRLIALYEDYILPATLKRAERIICSSDKVRNIFLSNFKFKSETITPGVNTDLFEPAATMPSNELLFVGSLNKSDTHKGLAFLLEALVGLVAKNPSLKLRVVGQGNGRPGFEEQVNGLGLKDHVEFLGGQFGEDLVRVYKSASIFILPTLNDSFPLVILEAMAVGLPVISTSVGGIPGMIDDQKTGYVIEPGNSQALAEKIQYLLDNPDIAQAFGKSGRTKVSEQLTWIKQAKRTSTVLTKAMTKTGDTEV